MRSDKLCPQNHASTQPGGTGPMGCHKSYPGIQTDVRAFPVWFGLFNEGRCQAVLNRLKRSGYLEEDFECFVELCGRADEGLFRAVVTNPLHVMRQLLLNGIVHTIWDLELITRSYQQLIIILRKFLFTECYMPTFISPPRRPLFPSTTLYFLYLFFCRIWFIVYIHFCNTCVSVQSCPRVTFLGPDLTWQNVDPTRDCWPKVWRDLTRPRHDPSPICIVFIWIIIY